MADEKISGMPAAATLDGTEEVPLVQGGANVRTTLADVAAFGTVSLLSHMKSWFAGEALDGRTIYTAERAEKVTAVIGRVDTVNGVAATLLVVKCASGTAPGAGTALTGTTMDLAGTPATNQALTLSVTPADLLLAAGDSLCLVETGALGTSVGCITVHTTPQ